ncbi:MAG: hypothetical protein GX564_08160 [Oligosphaeraceae bacterium]|nr:hypothetical protein [Oligosphaeraceae bacterium]
MNNHPSAVSHTASHANRFSELSQTLVRWYLCLLIFLLPLKFGTFIGGGEQPDLPLDVWEWALFTCWPAFLPGAAAGVALLLACCLRPLPRLSVRLAIPLLAAVPLLAGLAGLNHTTEWEYAFNWLRHFWGAACLALAVYWAQDSDEKLLPALLNTIALSTLLCCLKGWQQHFGGLSANRQMMLENARETGQELTAQIQAKLSQTRAYGYFVDPNIYAAHLLLTCPLLLLALHNWSQRFALRRWSRVVFLGGGGVLFLGALLWSGSRGALLGFGGGLAVCIWLCPLRLSWRLGLLGGGAALSLALMLAVTLATDRDLLSASVRLQYYRTSVQIFSRYPVTGAGLGEFFPWHMRLKPPLAEEARDPHSMLFALLGQCGVPGLLAACLRLAFPLALVLGFWRQHQHPDRRFVLAAGSGWCAWLLHSQFQFNDTIPGTVFLASFVGLWLFAPAPERSRLAGATGRCANVLWRGGGILAGLLAGLVLLRVSAEHDLQLVAAQKVSSLSAALSRLRSVEERLPYSPTPCRLRSEIALANGDLAAADASCRLLVQRTPHRSSSHCRLAKVQLLRGDLAGAGASLEQARLWYPYNPRLFPLLAYSRLAAAPQFAALPLWQQLRCRQVLLDGQVSLEQDSGGLRVLLQDSAVPPSRVPEALPDLLSSLNLTAPDGSALRFVLP